MWRPRSHLGGPRDWAIGILLVVLLGSIGVLAYEAVGLDWSHRAVAEGILHDYSAFAADQFARLAADRISALTRTILEPVACGTSLDARQAAAVERTATSSTSGACSCGNPAAVDGFFEADLTTGAIVLATGGVDDIARELLQRADTSGSSGVELMRRGGRRQLVAYRSDIVPGSPAHVAGFVGSESLLEPVFERIVQSERLLPGSLTDPRQNREYLSITAGGPDGTPIYRTGAEASAFSVERAIDAHGTLTVRLGVNEAAAGRLIIGGVPRSRLPLVLSMLAITVGLLAVAAWQVQRERRLAEMRVDFVRSASHELRTPLAQIRLFTETVQLGRVRSWDEVQQSLAFVDQQTRRLSRLVENLLTFSSGTRRRDARVEPIELPAFLEELRTAFEPVAAAAGQRLRLDLGEPCRAAGDREWLMQVLVNLLENAVKYGSADQTITLSLRGDESRVRIAVEDQGPGVPARDRQRIFAPFVRLSREHERRTGGTGIGLAVASDLMAAMNGSVRAESPATSGARFVVELPVATPEGSVAGAALASSDSAEARHQVA